MSKTKFKNKTTFKNDFEEGHRKVRKQKSLYDRKHFREIDNVLKTRNVDRILSHSDDQF